MNESTGAIFATTGIALSEGSPKRKRMKKPWKEDSIVLYTAPMVDLRPCILIWTYLMQFRLLKPLISRCAYAVLCEGHTVPKEATKKDKPRGGVLDKACVPDKLLLVLALVLR